MNNDSALDILIRCNFFQDLKRPVILTSGLIGIYYANTEFACPNNAEILEKFGDDANALITAANAQMKDKDFNRLISILAEEVQTNAKYASSKQLAVAGGQRRDWIFSGPVAEMLGVPHIALYKQEKDKPDKIEVIMRTSEIKPIEESEFQAIIVSDLLTKGDSQYRISDGKEFGWIPMLRNAGFYVNRVISVVSRQQGGERNLMKQGIIPISLVKIDGTFLRKYSKNPDVAIEYSNPEVPDADMKWSVNYLKEHGALEFLPYFDPSSGKLDRARKFAKIFNKTLRDAGRLEELAQAVKSTYQVDYRGLVEGR